MTVFLGCGFAAKYARGGGNFSVPLQWMLGLKRLGVDAVWVEVLQSTGDPLKDGRLRRLFLARMRALDLKTALFTMEQAEYQERAEASLDGMSTQDFRDRLAGPHVLLNLSYSIRAPFLFEFSERWFCDLDPGEIGYWMTQMEMGQTQHQRFFTIGLNIHAENCKTPRNGLNWETFAPLADTEWYRPSPRPALDRFTTIGQWYWDGCIEVDGEYPYLSKGVAFEKFLPISELLPEVHFELAVNLGEANEEADRLRGLGWELVDPHRVAANPGVYRRYLANATGEFTSIKGVDCLWQTGWVSDRTAAFLASGRPVLTEDTGAGAYLSERSGCLWVHDSESAKAAVEEVLGNWERYSAEARACAVEIFDAAHVLRTRFGLG